MDFFDLKKQYQNLKPEIDAAVSRVFKKGVFIGGEEVESFEKEIAEFLDARHIVSLNSGTDALYLALRALDVGSGDEVITTPFTFIATAEAIAASGAKPVFVDINPKTFNVDASKIEAVITKKTKAIIPVHLYGQMAEMEKILTIAKKHNLKIIEDAAQAIGSERIIKGKKKNAGTIGDVGCFSFFPTKNLGAYGDGGMVATNNKVLADKIRILKTHGSSPKNKYNNLVLGINSRLDAIQAAILGVKIKFLPKWNKKREKLALWYTKNLLGVGNIITPFVAENNMHIYHQYVIKSEKRDKLREFLKAHKIPTLIHYPTPLHLQPALKYLGYKKYDLPETEQTSEEILSLPIYPELSRIDQKCYHRYHKRIL